MAAQGERVSGAIGMDGGWLESMAQDGDPEQDIVMGEQELPPQMDPKPKMAAVYDTSPPLLHQNPPPIPAETAHPGASDMAQLFAMLAGMRGGDAANETGNEQQNGWHDTNNAGRDAVHGCGPTGWAGQSKGGTRATKGGNREAWAMV